MKKIFTTLAVALALTVSVRAADSTVTLSKVHICCGNCVKNIDKTVATIPGLTDTADQDAGTVVLTGPDTTTLQKGVDALVANGFYGKSSDAGITVSSETGAKNEKMTTMTIEHLHLCCGHCVKSVNEILTSVPGVTGNTAAKGVKSFDVTGDFNDKDVFDALQKGGLTGHEKMN